MQIVTTRHDVIWNYAGTIVSMLSNFLLLPFLVSFLSGEELGLWYVYAAVGNLVTLFEFGFSPTFSRNFAYCWSGARELTKEGCVQTADNTEVDPDLLAHLIAACKLVYRYITLIAFAILLVPGTLYIASVTGGLDRTAVFASWAIYCCGVLLNLYFLWYSSALRGIGSVAADNQIKIAARVVQIALSAALLILGLGLIGACTGFFVSALVFRILCSRSFWSLRTIRVLDLRSICINNDRRHSIFKAVSYNAFKDGGVQLSNYASTQASSLICSSFLGLEQAGAFSIALQFATAIGNLSQALMTSCRPMLQSAYQRGDRLLVRKTLGVCAAVYVAIFVVMFFGVYLAVYPILNVFKSGGSFDSLVYAGVSLYMFLFNWCALFASMLANMNTIPYLKAYVLTAVAGIALSVTLTNVSQLGVWGLVLGLAVPQCVYNVWYWPHETARRLDSTPFRLLQLGCSICAKRVGDVARNWKCRCR